MINVEQLNERQIEDFQIELMKTQMALEDSFTQIAKDGGEPSVILCDRGLMDSLGYSSQEMFDRMLERMGWDVMDLRDKRYDGVIHMITAADGAASFYDHANEARYESVEEAVARDRQLRKAYIGHNKLFIIRNDDTFKDKMAFTIKTVLSILGLPTEKLKFKKYLVDTGNLEPSKMQCEIKNW